ncbi:MAG: hypothetical protein C4523_18685 [Myxococcales bacterium]|nr:MAG: hypothetical protein C4523_18685 [Myxococcales bacterium]
MTGTILSVEDELATMLDEYGPLLTPEQVEKASQGLISRATIYRRGGKLGAALELDIRRIGGRVLVTKESLYKTLCGQPEKPV